MHKLLLDTPADMHTGTALRLSHEFAHDQGLMRDDNQRTAMLSTLRGARGLLIRKRE